MNREENVEKSFICKSSTSTTNTREQLVCLQRIYCTFCLAKRWKETMNGKEYEK